MYSDLEKKTGSTRKLSSYRGIFLVPVLSIIFEKLLKNRITPHLKENMTQFQTGGVKGEGVTDNLFILRGMINHSKYLGKELWITFCDTEKCFDSLLLEDCINCLWRCGVKDDILYLVFQLNKKAMITERTPVGNTEPFQINNIVKQGTVLGPVLNNCSLDDNCAEGQGYVMGTVAIKALEFVDDIADLNSGLDNAANSNKIIVGIQERKCLKFADEKCRILKINSFDFSNTVSRERT